MNQWWFLGFIAFTLGIALAGEKYGENKIKVACEKQDEAQQQNTIMAQQHVISQIGVQDNISKGETNAYQSSLNAITILYHDVRLPAPANATGTNLRTVPAAAGGTQTSKRYRLTPQQCDQEEAKCNALWNWAQQQSAVK